MHAKRDKKLRTEPVTNHWSSKNAIPLFNFLFYCPERHTGHAGSLSSSPSGNQEDFILVIIPVNCLHVCTPISLPPRLRRKYCPSYADSISIKSVATGLVTLSEYPLSASIRRDNRSLSFVACSRAIRGPARTRLITRKSLSSEPFLALRFQAARS